MTMQTNLHGRLRNTSLSYHHGHLPVFEAVVNSIHSIEELNNNSSIGKIILEINRIPQSSLDLSKNEEHKEDITGFKIIDNGIGFNDDNMESFSTLDSEYKIDKGCRGVGRLLWLKAFNSVHINSSFGRNGSFISREFKFDDRSGVGEPQERVIPKKQFETVVSLNNFKEKYRKATHKTIKPIATSLLEHCLWYFVRDGGCPKIIVRDGEEVIDLDELYNEYMLTSAKSESIKIKGHDFELTHIKVRGNSTRNHSISYCAANRLVKEESIVGKIPGLSSKISDGENLFIYSCYVGSSYLDEKVRSERTGFDLIESENDIFSNTEISLNDLQDAIYPRVSAHLHEHLSKKIEEGRDRVESFVATKAPKYRPLLHRIPKENLIVDPSISDRDLDIVLHKQLSEIEREMLDEGHSVMTHRDDETQEEYQVRLQNYVNTVADFKKSDLANYVSHRKVIIDLLESAIQRQPDGKYAREDVIHELIMPMRVDSNEVLMESCNLWLLDERLAFHDYLASDKTLKSMPITGNNEAKEPDLCALNVCDNPILVSEGQKLPLASIVVVEIKRPMRNDAKAGEDKDPIEQALGYLNRIREGKVQTSGGRQIPNSEDIPGYCYVLCDITETVERRCKLLDLTATSDHLGYFGFHKIYKSYIEVISFDRLVNSAKERNRAFFDQLGLPTG